MNKKQLYESIMASVAKEVKKALNETLTIPDYREIIDIIKSTDWNTEIAEESYDSNLGIYGGNIYMYIPNTDDLILDFDVEFKWKYNKYIPATRYQPAEGGYNELKNYTIKKVTLYNDDIAIMDLPELKEYVHYEFADLINKLADEIMYNSDEYNKENLDD